MSDQIGSSIVNSGYQKTPSKQFTMGTWTGLIPILVFAFFIIKSFIYTKDDKRHGK